MHGSLPRTDKIMKIMLTSLINYLFEIAEASNLQHHKCVPSNTMTRSYSFALSLLLLLLLLVKFTSSMELCRSQEMALRRRLLVSGVSSEAVEDGQMKGRMPMKKTVASLRKIPKSRSNPTQNK